MYQGRKFFEMLSKLVRQEIEEASHFEAENGQKFFCAEGVAEEIASSIEDEAEYNEAVEKWTRVLDDLRHDPGIGFPTGSHLGQVWFVEVDGEPQDPYLIEDWPE